MVLGKDRINNPSETIREMEKGLTGGRDNVNKNLLSHARRMLKGEIPATKEMKTAASELVDHVDNRRG